MTDDNIINTNQKPVKNPLEGAANAIREAQFKEWDAKIKDQAKKVVAASKVLDGEKEALRNMVADFDAEKKSLNATLKDL